VNGPLLIALDGVEPEVEPTAWLAPGVVVSGDVRIGAGANLWFGVVARGDVEPIDIGPNVNVQDGSVLHTDPDRPLVLEQDVAVGHRAVVHGCTVGAGALVGMGATVLSGAEIGEGAIVGAGAVVLEGAKVPPRSLVVGVPARVVGTTTGDEGRRVCERYRRRADRYRQALANG
jgi:carbonic anhydrase/acetyltransferase-like protein (isoleucine patch superfamily)